MIRCQKANRIALFLPCLLPFGGAERLAVSQANEFVRFGYDVDFVFASEPRDVSQVIPRGSRAFNLEAQRLRDCVGPFVKYLRAEKPDAVHVLLWPLTVVSLIAHRLAGSAARMVVSDHNTLSKQYSTWGVTNRLALRASLAASYRLADARVAVSRGVAEDLSALSGIARERFTVIHNAMPLLSSDGGEPQPSNALWGDSVAPRILSVGRMKAQKNHALLIKAFKVFAEKSDARLTILGDGDLLSATQELVDAEGLSSKVFLRGHVDDPLPFYRSADLFVLSSNYEGFGNVIVEALACGLRVVSTDCPSGPAEILESGRWGRLTPVGDVNALAEAIEVSLASQHDPDSSRRRALDFAPDISARSYLDLLIPSQTEHREPCVRRS